MVVEKDAPSLKKNIGEINFYETVKATLSQSSLGACFSITIPMERWNEREWFIWTYMHILKTLT